MQNIPEMLVKFQHPLLRVLLLIVYRVREFSVRAPSAARRFAPSGLIIKSLGWAKGRSDWTEGGRIKKARLLPSVYPELWVKMTEHMVSPTTEEPSEQQDTLPIEVGSTTEPEPQEAQLPQDSSESEWGTPPSLPRRNQRWLLDAEATDVPEQGHSAVDEESTDANLSSSEGSSQSSWWLPSESELSGQSSSASHLDSHSEGED